MSGISAWPKHRPTLSPEQYAILEDWYAHWLTTALPRYGSITRFNHEYPLRSAPNRIRTLEIGAGTGEHLLYEKTAGPEYYAMELRRELADRLTARFPAVTAIIGDCENRIDAPDHFFDRVLAVHVLEHLANLPATLREVVRVLRPGGVFSVVIPCEGGMGYRLGRYFTSQRQFEKRYGVRYDWMISYEHVNRADEIVRELKAQFTVKDRTFYPLRVPSINLNLVMGLTLEPRPIT